METSDAAQLIHWISDHSEPPEHETDVTTAELCQKHGISDATSQLEVD